MAIDRGWDGAVLVGSNEMVKMNEWSLEMTGDALENTNFGSTVVARTYQPGLRSYVANFSGYSETTNAAQSALEAEMTTANAPAAVTVVLLTNNTTGTKSGFTGSGVITGLTRGAMPDGMQTFSGSVQISGQLATYAS